MHYVISMCVVLITTDPGEATPPALTPIVVKRFLKQLAPSEIRSLGLELGLRLPHLKRMNDDLDEMIHCWLREDDDVYETSGIPSWENLVKALEEAGFKGVAADIRRGMYT